MHAERIKLYKQLHAVHVGLNKADCDMVEDMDLSMAEVMTIFGRYVKFVYSLRGGKTILM